MKLTFLGAAQTVTGSKYLLEINDQKILVDCGLFQGLKELRLRNWAPFYIDPKKIDVLLLTHAHIDHSGYIPLLVKNGFRGKIYCSRATKELCAILLPDSGRLQEEDAAYANRKGYSKHKPALPLYTEEDANQALKYFYPIEIHRDYSLANDVTVRFNRAGHILGASTITVTHNNKKILFSGDVGRLDDPIMKAPEPVHDIDYLIVESTYGGRIHPDKGDLKTRLAKIINDVVQQQGTVLIPAFAVGRTQLILYYLEQMRREKLISTNIPIYLDSPMAINASELYCIEPKEHRLSLGDCQAMFDIVTYVRSVEESKQLNDNSRAKIIISASGMATGGRVVHHLEYYLGDPKNAILFVGYQAIGTRGHRLISGEKQIKMFGKMVEVKARIEDIKDLSAHSDVEEIITWLEQCNISPQEVFIAHGEPKSSNVFKEKLEEKFGWKCIVPEYLQTVEL